MEKSAGWLVLVAVLGMVLGTGCMGVVDDSGGPNHAPDTVFLDGEDSPTPPPGSTVTTESVTFLCWGTDVIDGDAIEAYHYRLSPRDTAWTRVKGSTVTLTGLADSTEYEFCVYAEDEHGAVDSTPTCRSFFLDIFRLGQVLVYADTTRYGDYRFRWEVVDSDIPAEDLVFSTQLVIWNLAAFPYGDPRGIVERGDSLVATESELLVPDPVPDYGYCLGVWAREIPAPHREPTPMRACLP